MTIKTKRINLFTAGKLSVQLMLLLEWNIREYGFVFRPNDYPLLYILYTHVVELTSWGALMTTTSLFWKSALDITSPEQPY